MSKCIKKYGTLIFTAALMVWLVISICCSAAFAEGSGAIRMSCRVNNTPISGMTWKIYKVGERGEFRSSLCYNAYEPFDEYYTRIDDITTTHLTDMASTLENDAVLDKIPPLDIQVSDQNGELTFSGLEPGLYLLSGKYVKSSDGVTSYKPSPSLVEITESQEVIHVNAKIKTLLTLNGEVTVHTVKKIWAGGMVELRPKSITAEIYKDEELFEIVELNEENNWTYEWITEEYFDWRVKEQIVPPGFTVIYRSNETDSDGNQYAIINSFVDDGKDVVTTTANVPVASETQTTTTHRGGALDEDSDTATQTTTTSPYGGEHATNTESGSTSASKNNSKSDSTSTEVTTAKRVTTTTAAGSKLPQTGQLWWPVPVLSFGGIIFIAVGFRMRKKQDTE